MARTKQGLSVKTFTGLSKKRMASKGGGANSGLRVILKDGDTIPVQFSADPTGFTEFEIHQWQEDGRWHNVPCLGDGCPLCDDESESKSKTKYRFAVPVWNFKEKKAQILEGPKDMAQKIFYKWEKKPKLFLKRTWDITRYPTNPTTYGCDVAEDDLIKFGNIKLPDIGSYLDNEVKAYFGDEIPTSSSLDSDDDDIEAEDDEADEWDEKELKKKAVPALKKIAKEEGVSASDIKEAGKDKAALIALILGEEDDEDDDDEDEDDDDDDLDDDDDDLDDDDDDDDEEDEDEDDDDDDDDDDDEEEDDEEDDDDDDEDDEPPVKKSKKSPAKSAPKKSSKKAPAKKPVKKGKKK